jgi:16S rRNA (adenine1518-N6/adenine1519-N6)-dimethyltransferase
LALVSRRLGQHILRAASVERLLKVIDPRPNETFLEIAAGRGALTLPLASRAKRVVAVELDPGLAEPLRERVPGNVEVVIGNALRLDLAELAPPGSRLVGNLPYYISSPLLRRFLGLRERVVDLHVMLQEEVARRVAGRPGSREYGILSVLLGLWADLDVPLDFGPGAFRPPPRVRSALLRARFRPEPRVAVSDEAEFERFVCLAFARRRRTLANNLQDSYPKLKESFKLLNIAGTRRAETLSVVEFGRLFTALAEP